MPLEIRELVIKLNIQEQQQQTTVSEANLNELKEKIIAECVAKVIKKIEKAQSR